jgi:hypothetical protein
MCLEDFIKNLDKRRRYSPEKIIREFNNIGTGFLSFNTCKKYFKNGRIK